MMGSMAKTRKRPKDTSLPRAPIPLSAQKPISGTGTIQGTKDALEGIGDDPTPNEIMVGMNRKTAMAMAGMQARLLKGGLHLAARIEAALSNPDTEVGTREALGMLRMIANIAARTAEVSRHVVQMDQVLTGKPTAIVQHQGLNADASTMMTPEEAEAQLERATVAFKKHLRRRTVIDTEDVSTQVDTEVMG